MTLDVFSPALAPTIASDKTTKTRVLRADFGDGYSQRTGDGTNNIIHTYSVVIEALTPSEADDIETFFEDHQGTTAFLYTFPGDSVQRKFITVGDWKRNYPQGNLATISVKFEEVFDL